MSILHAEQQPIADKIFSNLSACELYNIPTGRGKTFILLDVAKRLIEKKKKKVIISVPNNYLAREMNQTAKEYFSFNESNSVVKIGRDNYINRVRLQAALEEDLLYDYCEIGSVDQYLDIHESDRELFFDDFSRIVRFKEISFQQIVKQLICFTDIDEFDVEFSDLTITNHYYLLSKTAYDKSFDFSEYTILIDEVHEIADVAEQIMTDSFSPFEYKNILSLIKKDLSEKTDFRGKLKLEKALKTQEVKAYKFFKKYTNENMVGEFVSSGNKVEEIRKSGAELLSTDNHEYIQAYLKSTANDYSSAFIRFEKILPSLNYEKISNNKISFGVYYSPSKGYPTLRASITNPLGKLHNLFWEKIDSFAGVSGSVTCGFFPDESEIKYGYSRLGMLKKNETRQIHFYDRIFPKENIRIYLPVDNFYKNINRDSVYSHDFKPDDSPYYEKIVDTINQMHDNKNTIVLCGGYKECEFLAKLYKLKYGDVRVGYSNTKEKTDATLEKFKSNGGILFATKNYGTGTSLEGDLLERLFILRFPYPDFTTKKWQELKQRSTGLFRKVMDMEMLVSFIQTLGRVPRTKEDRGDIIVLDHRYEKMKPEVKKKITDIVKEYGIIQTNTKKEIKKDYKDEMEGLFL